MSEDEARLHLAAAVREKGEWEALPETTRIMLEGLAAKATDSKRPSSATTACIAYAITTAQAADLGCKRDAAAAAEDLAETEASDNSNTAERVCPICFTEPVALAGAVSSDRQFCCPVNPDHIACKGCTELHIHHRITEGMTILTCPVGYDSCRHRLTVIEVAQHATTADQQALAALQPTKQRRKKAEWCKWRRRGGSQRREGISSRLRSWCRTMLWTKKCSNCNARIEKNGGCTHMTCRCGHEICWCYGGDYVRKNGSRGHAGASGGIFFAAFPPPVEWGNACHSTKIWAIRILGTPIVLTLGGLALGVAAVAGILYGTMYLGVYRGLKKVGSTLRKLFQSRQTKQALAPCPMRPAGAVEAGPHFFTHFKTPGVTTAECSCSFCGLVNPQCTHK
jgi:hypothetical protein